MTLVAVWVRKNSTLRELVMASDSRVSGGESWDSCPKIVPLPRPATAIAMSGDATAAYAFLLHAINTCLLLDGNKSGRTDIGYVARKLRDVYAASRIDVTDLPPGQKRPDLVSLDVVLVGWSWRHLRFEGYSFSYDQKGDLLMKSLTELEDEKWAGVYFAGDAAPSARKRLKTLLQERDFPFPMQGSADAAEIAHRTFLDWEPLEILEDLIGDKDTRTAGGAPQVLRIYQYGECESFVWRDAEGNEYFGGRRVRHGERFDRRVMQFSGGSLTVRMSDNSVLGSSNSAEATSPSQVGVDDDGVVAPTLD